jgi:hypothetical protein
MMINGRVLKRAYQQECSCCAGKGYLTLSDLDYDQYWILDYEGQEDRLEGSWLYDRVAYPTLREAQRKHLEDLAFVQVRREQSQKTKRPRRAKV